MRGHFIVFEGPDGSGKTSALKTVFPRIQDQVDAELVISREPGGSRIAEKIRQIILDPAHTEMDVRTEALLYAASRRQHITELILPALDAGKIILCDRFIDSSLAYQGNARGIGIEEVYQMNRFAIQDLEADLTLYFDIDSKAAMDRIYQNRKDEQFDRLDQEALSFHEAVVAGYKKIYQDADKPLVIIDATQDEEDVASQVERAILDYLKEEG